MPHILKLRVLLTFTILFFSLSKLSLASDQDDMISNEEIARTLSNLSLEEGREFSGNLTRARALVATKLTSIDPKETYEDSLSLARHLLKVFESEKKSETLQNIANTSLVSFEQSSLTLKRYLEFCLALNPIKEVYFSSLSTSETSYNKMLHDLDFPGMWSFSKTFRPELSQLGKPFKKAFSLSPFDVYCFKENYKNLKKIIPLENLERGARVEDLEGSARAEKEQIPFRLIAEKLLSFTDEDIRLFCQNIFLAQNALSQNILNYQIIKEDKDWFREIKHRKNNRALVEMFETYPEELKEISQFPLLNHNGKTLTVKNYLTFWIALFPKHNYQDAIPFVRQNHWFNYESILASLGLNTEFQRDARSREIIDKLTSVFEDSWQVDSIKLYRFSKNYKKLITRTNEERVTTFGEDLNEVLIRYRAPLAVTATSLTALWWGGFTLFSPLLTG